MKRYRIKYNKEKDSIVKAMAIVDSPAIQSNFLKFSKQEKNSQFLFKANDERREIIGAAMIPDIDIYRKDAEGNEFNVFFTAGDIREFAKTFFDAGYNQSTNLQHKYDTDKYHFYQSFIVDYERGIKSPDGLDLPDGTWLLGATIKDDGLWQNIKEGKYNGFSIELAAGDLVEESEDEYSLFKLIQQFNKLNNK